jgi:hypothetical protein
MCIALLGCRAIRALHNVHLMEAERYVKVGRVHTGGVSRVIEFGWLGFCMRAHLCRVGFDGERALC